MMSKKALTAIRLFVCTALVLLGVQVTSAKPLQMSMGCGPSVAAGYPAGVALANFLNQKNP